MLQIDNETLKIFEAVRNLYIEEFVSAITRFKAATLQIEPVMLHADGQPAREGRLNTPLRLDLVQLRNEPSSIRVDSTKLLRFDEFVVEDERVAISVSSFFWDAVTVEFNGYNSETDKALVQWFERQFQEKAHETKGYFQCIHFLSDPIASDGVYEIEVDLGTAPVGALANLLDALASSGATKLSLYSKQM